MSTATIAPTGTWTVDATHSKVGFAVKHLGIATVRGGFKEFEGTLEIGEDLAIEPRVRHGQDRVGRHERDRSRRAPARAGLLQRRGQPGDHVRVDLDRAARRGRC